MAVWRQCAILLTIDGLLIEVVRQAYIMHCPGAHKPLDLNQKSHLHDDGQETQQDDQSQASVASALYMETVFAYLGVIATPAGEGSGDGVELCLPGPPWGSLTKQQISENHFPRARAWAP